MLEEVYGGEGGIRTPGARKGSLAFEASAIDHSATSPQLVGHLSKETLGPEGRDPWREAAAFMESRALVSLPGTLPKTAVVGTMRMRILSLPVSTPRWQFRPRIDFVSWHIRWPIPRIVLAS